MYMIFSFSHWFPRMGDYYNSRVCVNVLYISGNSFSSQLIIIQKKQDLVAPRSSLSEKLKSLAQTGSQSLLSLRYTRALHTTWPRIDTLVKYIRYFEQTVVHATLKETI